MGKEIRLNCITAEYFTCHLCKNTVKRPVECSVCEQLFCFDCLKVYFNNSPNIKCPIGCLDPVFNRTGHAFEKLMGFIYTQCRHEQCTHSESIKTLWVHEKNCGFRKQLNIETCEENLNKRDAFWMEILQKVLTPSSQNVCVQNFMDNSRVSCTARTQQTFKFN